MSVRVGGRPKWPFAVGAVVVVAVLAIFLLTRGGSGSDSDEDVAANAEPGARQPTAGYRIESRPVQGFSVEVPVRWQAAPDNTDTTLSYAESRPTEGSLRVSVNRTEATLADSVARLTDRLRDEGGQDITQTPTTISGVPAIRLDYRFPSSPTPGSTLASHSSYLVVRNGTIYSFQLATTDPGSKESIFAYMATKFTLL